MNQHETRALLRARSALTSQPYGDDVVNAWCDALNAWTLDECRAALIKTSREHQKITVAHLVEKLPHHPHAGMFTQVRHNWDGPTDRGRAIAAEIREHINHRNEPDHPAACSICRHDRYPSVTDEPDEPMSDEEWVPFAEAIGVDPVTGDASTPENTATPRAVHPIARWTQEDIDRGAERLAEIRKAVRVLPPTPENTAGPVDRYPSVTDEQPHA